MKTRQNAAFCSYDQECLFDVKLYCHVLIYSHTHVCTITHQRSWDQCQRDEKDEKGPVTLAFLLLIRQNEGLC